MEEIKHSGRSYYMVGLVLLIFFVISFLTNILGPLVPDIINSFVLSLTHAGFLPFSFVVAYGVASIPAGILVEKYTEKPVLLASFVLAFAGSVLFASIPSFPVAMISLFLFGIGMAMLQVVHYRNFEPFKIITDNIVQSERVFPDFRIVAVNESA